MVHPTVRTGQVPLRGNRNPSNGLAAVDSFYVIFAGVSSVQPNQIAQLPPNSIRSSQPQRSPPAPNPHHSTLRRMCHPYSAELPPQCLVKLQFRGRHSAQVRMLDQVRITPTDSAQARRCDCRGGARLAKQTGLHATCRRLFIINAGHMHSKSALTN